MTLDMRNTLLLIVLTFTITLAHAQIPAGYYDAATGTGYTLKTQLHNIIDGHNSQTYDALWTHFQSTDVDNYYEDDGSPLDMYSENPTGADPYNWTFVSDQCGNYSGEGSCYNREHSFPKSWFNDGYPMYTDLFHLYLTDGYVNGQRGNLPFGEVSSPDWTSQNGSEKGSCSYPGYSGTVFEPIDEFKGDFARSYFYMATRYEDVISGWPGSDMLDGSSDQVYADWALNMLLEWHANDPVSQKEIDRNDAVYGIQLNRNPFIDHPEYVNQIWGGGVVNPQPDNHLTSFSATVSNYSTIELTWTDATGTNLPDAYLIMANTTGAFSSPVDGTEPSEDSDLSDGSAIVKVAQSNQSYTFSGLSGETTYYFKAWSYANYGNDIDFKLDGTVPTANATTGEAPVSIFSDDFESDLSAWTVTNDADPSAAATLSSLWGGAESSANAVLFDAGNPATITYYTSSIEYTITNAMDLTLDFWYYFEDYRGGEVNIYLNETKVYGIATEGGGDIAIGEADDDTWTNLVLDLSSHTISQGDYTIKIEGISKCASTWQDRVAVDQIKVFGTQGGVKPEPTNHVADFVPVKSVTLSWGNSDTPENYLIMINTTGCGDFVAPVDGTTYSTSEYLKIVAGNEVSYQWSNLSAGQPYYFVIVPFNGGAGNENYKTDGTIPCVQKDL
jgi:endonuclease I